MFRIPQQQENAWPLFATVHELLLRGVNVEFSAGDYPPDVTMDFVRSSTGSVRIRDAGRYIPETLAQIALIGRDRVTFVF